MAAPQGGLTQTTVQSRDDGSFLFEGLASGEAELWADFSDARSLLVKVGIPGGPVFLTVERAGLVEGRIVWPDGRPYSEDFLLLLVRSGPISVDSLIPVPGRYRDPEGAFRIDAVPPGLYRLQANLLAVGGEGGAGGSAQSAEFEVKEEGKKGLLVVIRRSPVRTDDSN